MRIAKLAVLTILLAAPAAAQANGIRDYSRHKPGAVTLPAAGKSYIDPVFKTKIIRVTDKTYGTRCYHAYSYWPAFNYNNTRLLLACDDKALLFRFSASTDTVTPDGTLIGNTGYKLQWEGATWSNSLADTLYALDLNGRRLWRVNVANRGAGGYTMLKDFSSALGTSVVLGHLTVSDNANVVAFYTKTSTGKRDKTVVWDRANDRTYVLPLPSGYALDENQIDKNGKTVRVSYTDGSAIIWNWKSGSKVWLKKGSLTDNAGGHWDMGRYFIVNSNQVRAGIAGRTHGSLKPADHVLSYKRADGKDNWTLCDHTSLRTKYEEFFVGSTYAGDGTWQAFENEIFLGYTDGHGFVRLAHHRSTRKQSDWQGRYWAEPRAVVDRRGRYVVYTSDLGSSTRSDVMIVKIPSAYWPDL
jgi:hypothetical protein